MTLNETLRRITGLRKQAAAVGVSLLSAGLSAYSACAAETTANHPEESTRTSLLPNIVLIVADDLGYGDLGIQGSTEISTPNIDSIAKEGIRFTNGYVSCPVCGPTRAGLLTGRYQQRFGFETNNGPEVTAAPNYGVPREERMLPEYLKEAGYVTGMMGKWHLGFKKEVAPSQRGFDQFFGFLSGYHGYYPDTPAPWESPMQRGNEKVVEKEYLTDAFAREAVKFIDENSTHPFFLYLAFNAVHSPLQAPTEMLKKFAHITDPKRRSTLAMVQSMDDAVGRVLRELGNKHIVDGTIVIFVSDNGGPLLEGNNAPLRGYKGTLYEGGVRVPFMIRWIGHLPGNRVFDYPVSTLDVMPSLFAAAGIEQPQAKLDGVNLLPYLLDQNTSAPHDTLYWRFFDKQKKKSLRHGNLKLVSEGGPWELYDLFKDIAETRNLADSSTDTVKTLEADWTKWNSQMIDPKWEGRMPPPPNAKIKPRE